MGLKIGEGVDHASLRAKAEYFQFNSVFIKKKIIFFKEKNRNRFKPTGVGYVQFFRTKTGSNWFGSVFSSFFRFGFGSVFSVLDL